MSDTIEVSRSQRKWLQPVVLQQVGVGCVGVLRQLLPCCSLNHKKGSPSLMLCKQL